VFICLFLKLKKSLWDFCYFIFVFDSISSRRNLNEGLVHCVKERRRRKKTIKEDARFLSHGIPYFFLPLCFFNLFCFLSFFFHSPYWSSMCIIAKQLQLQQREQRGGSLEGCDDGRNWFSLPSTIEKHVVWPFCKPLILWWYHYSGFPVSLVV